MESNKSRSLDEKYEFVRPLQRGANGSVSLRKRRSDQLQVVVKEPDFNIENA